MTLDSKRRIVRCILSGSFSFAIISLATMTNFYYQKSINFENKVHQLNATNDKLGKRNAQLSDAVNAKRNENNSLKIKITQTEKKMNQQEALIKKQRTEIDFKASEIKRLRYRVGSAQKTKETVRTTRETSTSSSSKFMITYYTAGYESTQKKPGEPGYGITASGKRVQSGVTIACPPQMKLGTKVQIDGIGTRICQDRGGAVKGSHIDVYVPSLKQAQALGKQYRKVKIIQ